MTNDSQCGHWGYRQKSRWRTGI